LRPGILGTVGNLSIVQFDASYPEKILGPAGNAIKKQTRGDMQAITVDEILGSAGNHLAILFSPSIL